MRRSLLFALLALVLLLGAAACGGGEDTTASPETVEETGPAGTVGTTTDGGTTDTETQTETNAGGGDGDSSKGKDVFAAAGCGGCHTLAKAGTSGNIGPNLDESKPDYDLVVERVTNGQGAMPSFKDQLSAADIQNVAAYVTESAGA